MAHAQKPDFILRRNGQVHLHQTGRHFSQLLAAKVCASAVVMLDMPRSEVVWGILATHSIRQFPLHFPSCASPCAITFQLDSTTLSPWKPFFRLGPCGFTEGQSCNGTQYIPPKKSVHYLNFLCDDFTKVSIPDCIPVTLSLKWLMYNEWKDLGRSSHHLRYYQGHSRYPAPMQK